MKRLNEWIAMMAVHEETTMGSGSILVTHPDNIQQAIPLRSGRLRVGSAPDNDLIIAGPDIAPHHATITRDERGHLIVEVAGEDIAGQGGMRLTFNLPQLAKPRALAWIGDYVVSYRPEI
jgi:pSer/pThr/pTyr-binding forkhead associated (FHA) protein